MIRGIQLETMTEPARPVSPGEDAGFGSLQTERGCLPLVALDVESRITGLVAKIAVRQTFRNVLATPIEATYIFPLPDRAAVTRFRLVVADRVIEGDLQERAAARQQYDEAIQAGHRAAIAEEDRPGVFSMRVGNLPPHENATVELELVGPLDVVDGEATFRFPLVVAPRYVPGLPLDGEQVGQGVALDTDQVPDASRISPPVLLPGFPNPVRLKLEVEIDPAGILPVGGERPFVLQSSLHSIIEAGNEADSNTIRVRLQPGERLNRDFILRFAVASEQIRSAVGFEETVAGQPDVFAVTIVPPALSAATQGPPRDVVFVVDRSGSMGGWKMVATRRACGRILDTLTPRDRFTVLAFDGVIEYPPEANGKLIEAGNRERYRVLEWLGKVDARGGTEMQPALEAAVKLVANPEQGRERIVVLLTDGQVSGEDVVIQSLAKAAKVLPRIYTVGIDTAVNAGFLTRLAQMGKGLSELVESEDRLDAVMDRFHRAIGTPVLTDLRLVPHNADLVIDSITPSRLPDVFAGVPVTIYGRVLGKRATFNLQLTGRTADGADWQQQLEPAAATKAKAPLLNLWGRSRVRELEDRYAARQGHDVESLGKEIVRVSLEAGVLSRFTAYVAVDRSEVVNAGGKVLEVIQPVEQPQGWAMAAAVGGSTMGAMPMACMAPAPNQSASRKRSRHNAAPARSAAAACPPEPACSAPLSDAAAPPSPTGLAGEVFRSNFDADELNELAKSAGAPPSFDVPAFLASFEIALSVGRFDVPMLKRLWDEMQADRTVWKKPAKQERLRAVLMAMRTMCGDAAMQASDPAEQAILMTLCEQLDDLIQACADGVFIAAQGKALTSGMLDRLAKASGEKRRKGWFWA